MGAEFTFFDYVDPGGTNVIHSWLGTVPTKVKAKFTKKLLNLEGTPVGQWTRPTVETLDQECAGVFEVRVPHMHRQFPYFGLSQQTQPNSAGGLYQEG